MNNETFISDNYVKEEFELNANKARLVLFGNLVFSVILFGLPFYFLWRENLPFLQESIEWYKKLIGLGIGLIIAIIGIIVHELIHGFFGAIFNKNGFKSIRFGILLKKGMAYCANTETARKNKYIVSLVMPGILLGIIPAIISLVIWNFYLLIFGIVFTIAASGDLILLGKICKYSNDSWIEDKIANNEVKIYIYRKKQ